MEHRHFLIYKPFKMVSQFISNDRHQKKKRFLGELYDFPNGCMAVGRLDETSEGLLIITTDGQLSNNINRSKTFTKQYYAQVDGVITEKASKMLASGVEITSNAKPYVTDTCDVKKLETVPNLPETKQKIRDERHGPTSWISLTLNEGKFRQVRKMTSAVGFPTLRLVRVRIGIYEIGTMKSGEVMELDDNTLRDAIS
ncbi:pseudouridine synthase [Nonlabens agnitus]|uniref:Pseudouridine synthase n=1 Tax=Nonlabens agnitus TaxID=870484 RepID=A0A2S9WT04_9FLAO|nr:pseudouridine synthase [Nonlabens agnitus]PRP66598.1 ribulose phosphate epimerase [Nonlabens agnitus]